MKNIRKRAAAFLGVCLLIAMTLAGALTASAASDARHTLRLNIPDSPELLQECTGDEILFYGTDCSFYATVRLGDGGNWGPLYPVTGSGGLVNGGANTDAGWGPLHPVNESENSSTVSVRSASGSGNGLIVLENQDIRLHIDGSVTLYATRGGGIRLEWIRGEGYSVENNLNLELELGDLLFENGEWSNTDTGVYRVTSVKDIQIRIPTDQLFLLNGTEMMKYLGICVENGYDNGYNSGWIQGRDAGYDAGYAEGSIDGRFEGYDSGYSEGKEDGFNEGWDLGSVMGYNEGRQEGISEGYEHGYSVGYDKGVDQGYAEGEARGYDLGHADGYTSGYNVGTKDGYNKGLTETMQDKDTMIDLIFGIFNAPVDLINGILNFELFGINLASLVKTLITLSVIALIVFWIMKMIK